MNKTQALLATTLIALAGAAFAQDDSDAARQARMDQAYRDHQAGKPSAEATVRRDLHEAGHSIHNGMRATGHAIHNGVRATGHAIHHGARVIGHAIHEGVNKITGN